MKTNINTKAFDKNFTNMFQTVSFVLEPFCRVGVSSGFESRAYSDVPAQPAEGLSTCRHQHVCSHHQVQHKRSIFILQNLTK